VRNPNEVAVFVHRHDRHLVLRRVDRRIWHVVAGVVEPGESFPTSAARELAEETGLVARIVDLETPQRYVIEDKYRVLYAPDVTEVLIHSFVARAPATWEPVLNEEHDSYRWCTLDEALEPLHWAEAKRSASRVVPARRRLGLI